MNCRRLARLLHLFTGMTHKTHGLEVTAAFVVGGRWVWKTWFAPTGNKHEAIIAKGHEIGATGWDFGNAMTKLTWRLS